jgi:hypothetical protein
MSRIITKIKKESLTTKLTLIIIGLAAVCGGYILFLAIAAPQQLAEATTAATNVVCNGCVGSSDIADNSIQSVDIRNGQVGSADIGEGQVTSGDIQDNSILSADIANGRIFSEDIRDGQVGSVDIGQGQVTSGDIQDNGITSADLGNVITIVEGSPVQIAPQEDGEAIVECPSGKIITGGGFSGGSELRIIHSAPDGQGTWIVDAINEATDTGNILFPYALCM